ncbi:DUF1750-domain-containing protein [Aspergillus taichungensis]|uniref:DUF1750-domain-containing protein n=1 Tax=Aspergillus taichungensis TaxID=482145 RepID=A0A2J5HJS8_9EURO|nr:DUF1750-domain-containing protein [Aspergillus taichungensis]
MEDSPANRLPAQLLPHMHLVSRHRYPVVHMMPTETVVEYLLSAPKIVREAQPMHWTFLDGPQDGTVMLTWQPLQHLGNNFASDGYVWADAEQAYTFEARGYVVEMYLHRSGYHPPNESLAIHSRRRYRLLPTKNPNPNGPAPDPALWIVHYSRAPPPEHVPANRIPLLPQSGPARAQGLHAAGPPELAHHQLPPADGPPGLRPRARPLPQLHGRTPTFLPPRHSRHARARGGPDARQGSPWSPRLDEDVSAGDLMDLLTPREVSKMRYQQHHEWMEEIFASPYAISQITPVSLGLGRKGELESLTAGFFDAPGAPPPADAKEGSDAAPATKLEPARAEEFADRVAQKVADMTAEIERLKRRHARRMSKFNRTTLLKDAERRLRESAADPAASGPEIWRLEGRLEVPGGDESEEDTAPVPRAVDPPAKYRVDDVVREVETAWQRPVVAEPKISCVQKGGLLEKIEPEPPVAPPAAPAADVDMGGMGPEPEAPVTGAPAPSALPATAPDVTAQAPPPSSTVPGFQPPRPDVDMDMGAGPVPAAGQPPSAVPAATASGETGEWVMVNEEQKEMTDEKPAADTPSGAIPGLTPGQTDSAGDTALDGANFDFTNMDSAGDALAAYTEQNEGLDLPDLDNSAFGDAFHASDNENTHHHDDDI